MQVNPSKSSGLFSYLVLLTLAFIVLEISYFFQWINAYLDGYRLFATHFSWPSATLYGFASYFGLQILLHLFFTFFVWGMARLVGAYANLSWHRTVNLGFSLWGLGIVTLLLANQYFYPNSKYSLLTSTFINFTFLKILLAISVIVWLLLGVIAFMQIVKYCSYKLLITAAIICVGGFLFYHKHSVVIPPQDSATQEKPNIILIGIDSLRPDYVATERPLFLTEFFKQATVFQQSYTPLARTFPAWASILTGQYPKNNHIRTLLLDYKDINLDHSLPSLLRKLGYHTVFASDEMRFSNISQRFGFDEIVSTPVGLNDFLIGAFNDFPMSNLLVNTILGKYVLPNSYGNRPAFSTYDPDSFLKLLAPTLSSKRDKPIFLSVHFCLAHFPFIWGNKSSTFDTLNNYKRTIHRVDQQVSDLFMMLEQNNLLKNTIVMVFSDHGEGFELPGDRVTDAKFFISNLKQKTPRFYPMSKDTEEVNQAAGHGGDVLALTQQHTVLAIREYGRNYKAGSITDRVSLLDLKPTILDLLNYSPAQPKMDGRSLKNYLQGKFVQTANSYFFMESDYTPEALRTVHPEMKDVIFEALDSVNIDPQTTLITLKENIKQAFYSLKQFAVLTDDWLLALYPQNKFEMMPILVNLKTKQWTNDLSTPFSKNSPANTLLIALKNFYGDEIKSVQSLSREHIYDSNP